MAHFVPPLDPATLANNGERLVATALDDQLSNSVTVYHGYLFVERFRSRTGREFFREGEIDFVIFDHRRGILVLEVKGGTITYDPERGYRREETGEFIRSPFEQARDNMHALLDRIREQPEFRGGGLPFVRGYAVVLPHCNWAGQLPADVQPEMLLCYDDLPRLGERIDVLLALWSRRDHIDPLDERSVRGIRGALQSALTLMPVTAPRVNGVTGSFFPRFLSSKAAPQVRTFRPRLEQLEGRTALNSSFVSNVLINLPAGVEATAPAYPCAGGGTGTDIDAAANSNERARRDAMTEAEWLGGTELFPMLEFLRRRAERKLRLFACACCRRVWHLLADARCRRAVETAERYADGLADFAELQAAYHAAHQALDETAAFWDGLPGVAAQAAGNAACFYDTEHHTSLAAHAALNALRAAADTREGGEQGASAERAMQCRLFRDIFGNPFRPAHALESAALAWARGPVVNLARLAYEERVLPQGSLVPARLTVVADALEEAGCRDPDILGHLRGPDPHVRGCFVLDALLGQ